MKVNLSKIFVIVCVLISIYLIMSSSISKTSIKVPNLEAGFDSSPFSVNKEEINSVFNDYELKINSMLNKADKFNTLVELISWALLLINISVILIVLYFDKGKKYDPSNLSPNMSPSDVLSFYSTATSKIKPYILVLVSISIVLTALSSKLESESTKVEKEVWELYSYVSFARTKISTSNNQSEVLNILDRIKIKLKVK